MFKRWINYLLTRLGWRRSRLDRLADEIKRLNIRFESLPIILPANSTTDPYIVLRDNRRVLAAKYLYSEQLIPTGETIHGINVVEETPNPNPE